MYVLEWRNVIAYMLQLRWECFLSTEHENTTALSLIVHIQHGVNSVVSYFHTQCFLETKKAFSTQLQHMSSRITLPVNFPYFTWSHPDVIHLSYRMYHSIELNSLIEWVSLINSMILFCPPPLCSNVRRLFKNKKTFLYLATIFLSNW